MKKQLLIALAVLFTAVTLAQTTPEKKESKFEFQVNAKVGFARLKQTGLVSLNGNINGSDLLLSYKISRKWDVASGVSFLQFDGNPTIGGETASIRNSYLQIPVRFTGDFNIFDTTEPKDPKIIFNIGLGLYANTLLKQELETVTGNSDTKNLGWNFGFTSAVGLKFLLTDALNVGLGLESQSEFTKMKKDGAEQRIEQSNSMYLKVGFTF
jgi:long-subunit fatty acid transport protein